MQVVILCGGLGTRLREETEYRPKPMVPIGGRPILWHIMKTYAHHGHKEFILCLGYKGEIIKDYFRNYLWHTSDVTLKLGREPEVQYHTHHDEEDWTVTLLDTGAETQTGGRLARALPPAPARRAACCMSRWSMLALPRRTFSCASRPRVFGHLFALRTLGCVDPLQVDDGAINGAAFTRFFCVCVELVRFVCGSSQWAEFVMAGV